MSNPHAARQKFPGWLRCAALIWLVIWIPVYWRTWGVSNFVHLCDIAVVLTCAGIFTNSALLLSSQAVGSLLVDLTWTFEVCLQFTTGRSLIGGPEYLFDSHYPLWVRLFSLFHIAMPPLLLWSLYRLGYDRRGWELQCVIALPLFIAARFTPAAQNINFAFSDPFVHRAWGPPPVHVLISWLFMVFVVYLPTHLLLKHFFGAPPNTANATCSSLNLNFS